MHKLPMKHRQMQIGATLLPLDFTPSAYQRALFEWVRSGTGNAVCRAVAGSGKTTALVTAAGFAQGDGLYLAFNTHIAAEIGARLRGVSPFQSLTINSLGNRVLRARYPGVRHDKHKYLHLIYPLLEAASATGIAKPLTADGEPYRLSRQELRALRTSRPTGEIRRLVDLSRSALMTDRLMEVAAHFALEIPADLDDFACFVASTVLAKGKEMREHVADFEDQIWVPVIDDIPVPPYDWLFIDECQDLSPAKLELVRRARDPERGRVLAVGDPNQAIMGFGGADADAFEAVRKAFDATVFPLSVCYRCPTSHIELARRLCPDIEAAPGAPAGNVFDVHLRDASRGITKGHMVVCRSNAPLVKLCFQLIADKVSAAIKGNDFVEVLLRALREISRLGWDFEDFPRHLRWWRDEQLNRLHKRKGDQRERIDKLNDTCDCLEIVYWNARHKTFSDLQAHIRQLFEEQDPDVTLSTVHRAKGLEADVVHILGPSLLRSPDRPAENWHDVQEHNVHYVALTRARKTIVRIALPADQELRRDPETS